MPPSRYCATLTVSTAPPLAKLDAALRLIVPFRPRSQTPWAVPRIELLAIQPELNSPAAMLACPAPAPPFYTASAGLALVGNCQSHDTVVSGETAASRKPPLTNTPAA